MLCDWLSLAVLRPGRGILHELININRKRRMAVSLGMMMMMPPGSQRGAVVQAAAAGAVVERPALERPAARSAAAGAVEMDGAKGSASKPAKPCLRLIRPPLARKENANRKNRPSKTRIWRLPKSILLQQPGTEPSARWFRALQKPRRPKSQMRLSRPSRSGPNTRKMRKASHDVQSRRVRMHCFSGL